MPGFQFLLAGFDFLVGHIGSGWWQGVEKLRCERSAVADWQGEGLLFNDG